ncbi:unnamed protein product [Leptosia nina]|uniref:Gustatory receptor n=1 Tax=Leptosia nina TaxID=320188 RepID=A0AAV1JPD4_9NEOP
MINETERIKLILAKELLKCPADDLKDTAIRDKIEDAARTIELCPFELTIFGLFGLNMSLPLYFINLCTATITWFILQFGNIINLTIRCIITEITWKLMKVLRVSFEDKILKQNEQKPNDIEETINIYNKIFNTFNIAGSYFKYYVLRDFLSAFVSVISATVGVSNDKAEQMHHFVTINAATNIIIACIPCTLMQALINEAEKIKVILAKELLKCQSNDESIAEQRIRDALIYIERHPAKLTVLHLFSLDMSLPLVFINLCTTYVIVTLQYTKIL